ncbi:hypothetical protein O6H91_11G109000 [Diphasiastrum complanatum]|uniref:Uncharacterized protein n=1 Tax=Diphasiastrum complanatum TaxID=34168 RepID=A0ACC2CCR2_DIPCM|nr:hypothetical protein O6H91_11G109000 [Diphasiastrum complanatum]
MIFVEELIWESKIHDFCEVQAKPSKSAMAKAAPAVGGGGRISHHLPHYYHHPFFFYSDPPRSSLLLCSPIRISLIPNEPTLLSSSTSLTSTALLATPPPTGCTPMVAESSMASSSEEEGQAATVERLWQIFFSDPSQWWDSRFDKEDSAAPDFKHKTTKQALWINDRFSPPWLKAKLDTLTQQAPQPSLSLSSSSSSSTSLISSGPASRTKELWEEFFSDPSQWSDSRSDKRSPRSPDFKHKTAKKALWIDNNFNPPWVHARLATMVQCQEHGESGLSTIEISDRMEQLWQEFFSDPSQWWDNRFIKRSPNFPDFKHKSTHEGLWMEGWLNPPWVKANMVTAALDQIQCGGGFRSRVPGSFGDNVNKLCKEGLLKEALHRVELMIQQNIQVPVNAYVGLLKGCTRRKALVEGKRVHALIVQSGLDSNLFLGNILVDMYAKCGNVLDAHEVFKTMPVRNVFSWTAMMSAYGDHGQGEEAIDLFHQMQQAGIAPDRVAFVVVLKACAKVAALEQGKQLHSQVIKGGFETDVIVGGTLVDMYTKCGCMEDAREVFIKMNEPDVFSWTAMIAGYARQGLGKEALALYEQMKQADVQPDIVTYVVLLNACASIAAIEQGKQLHFHIIESGFALNVIVGNTLVDMYAKCGSIKHARQVFNNMHERNVVSWNAMISGYAQQGLGKEAVALYEQMKQEDVQPTNVTYVVLLNACASIADLEQGKQLHSQVIKSGFESDVSVGNTLVDMYAKCGSIEHAREVFNNIHEPNVVSWNVMIAGYAQQGLGKEAIALYKQMQQEDVQPNNVTYVGVLNACASIAALEEGKQLHFLIVKSEFAADVIVGNTLVDMYAKCGSIELAREVFNNMQERNVVSWNAMIAGYAQQGLGEEAFALYNQMKQEDVQPTNVTYVILLNACASIAALDQGKKLHFDIIKSGFESDVSVGNTLVDMYAKCGSIEHACQVFNNMHERNVVSWNAMIAGYAQQELGKEAIALYEQMKQEDVHPDIVTYVVLLKACASIAALEEGKQLHSHIINRGFESDVIVGNALVDMYAKCGSIQHARQVFNNMHERNVVSWNAIIMGYAQQGLGKEALTLLDQMQREGTKPNEVTYVCVLSACSHSGLINDGRHLFDSMYKDYGVRPTMDHYACMVDLLCRAGCLANAEDFINNMPIQPDAVIWMTLLGAARNHGDVEIGRRAFDCVVKLEPGNAAAYVLLANIYAAGGTRLD